MTTVKWGELQSILQIIVGLNLAYYSFREMRAPYLRKLRTDTESLYDRTFKEIGALSEERRWARAYHLSGMQALRSPSVTRVASSGTTPLGKARMIPAIVGS